MDRRNVDKDIELYITNCLENCRLNINQKETCAIKQAICKRGQGLFLYARLMMERLLHNTKEIIPQLDELPDGLGDMYINLLREYAARSGTTTEFQKLVLEWVTHSSRPLRVIELATIINSLPGRGGLNQNQDAKLAVRTTCGPLLEVCEDEVVQIIHHSFTEFLLGSKLSHIQMTIQEVGEFPLIVPSAAHEMIARACINYLPSGCFDAWEVFERSENVADELTKSMHDLYSAVEENQHTPMLYPLDQFRNSLCSFISQNTKSFIDALEIQEFNVGLPERIISLGNETLVEEIVRTKKLNLVEAGGRSALHFVAHWGLVSMMERLIPYVDDLQAFSPPLLHVASGRALSNVEMVKVLIKLGVDVNAQHRIDTPTNGAPKEFRFFTLLHTLATGKYSWYPRALTQLLEAGADIEMKNERGETALQVAIGAGNPNSCFNYGYWCDRSLNVLLKHGADVNIVASKTGLTPLNIALEHNRELNIVQKFLDHGADGSFGPKPVIASATDNLNYAALKILKAGANPNITYLSNRVGGYGDKLEPETSLQSAASSHMGYYYDAYGHRAALAKTNSIIMLLLEHGADPNQKLYDGVSTVFHEIAPADGLVEPIIAAGISLEMVDSMGRTPLIRSCSSCVSSDLLATEQEHGAIKLIKSGANIHAVDNTGSTALHLAVKYNLSEIVKKLLEYGASATAKDNTGASPLYYALMPPNSWYGMGVRRWAVEALLDAGADPLEMEEDGKTAPHYLTPCLMYHSSLKGRREICQYQGGSNEFAEYFETISTLH